MKQYSFLVWSPGELPLPSIKVLLERGQNIFTVALSEDAYRSMCEHLIENKVRILRGEPIGQQEPYNSIEGITQLVKTAIEDGHLLPGDVAEGRMWESLSLKPVEAEEDSKSKCSECTRMLTVPLEDRPFVCGFCMADKAKH